MLKEFKVNWLIELFWVCLWFAIFGPLGAGVWLIVTGVLGGMYQLAYNKQQNT